MRFLTQSFFLLVVALGSVFAQNADGKLGPDFFARYKLVQAPPSSTLLLKKGDRLAICGDSITEQKMYSRIMETYLTACVPELEVTVRQYGWSGETAPGFLARMTNDCLRFQPTIATTCYGMNDHGYRPYLPEIGERYRRAMKAILESFQGAGARVVLGSSGCVGKVPAWSRYQQSSKEDLNLNLGKLRNLDVELAQEEKAGFADVFWPMLKADSIAREKYGPNYAVAGKDGVHPDWAGHLIMAYAFLKAMGLDGAIGTFTVDWGEKKAAVSSGHELLGFRDGVLEIRSNRYPFCSGPGAIDKDDSLRSGMSLVPFNEELNRLILIVKNGNADRYRVTWGNTSKTYSARDLGNGINLAADFPVNPFSPAFEKIDATVAAKQAYETRQIKMLFHGEEGKADLNETADLTEKARSPLAKAIHTALIPVTHRVQIDQE